MARFMRFPNRTLAASLRTAALVCSMTALVVASTARAQELPPDWGEDLDWFWRTMFYETWTLDQAVASVDQQSEQVLISIEDRGLSPLPARVRVKSNTMSP